MICKIYVSQLNPSPNWKYTGLYGRINLGSTLQIKDMGDNLLFEHPSVKMTQLGQFFYAFPTADYLVGLSFDIKEYPDELFKDTLATLTKEKKKPKTKKVDKSMISGPSGFQHVSHVGYAKGKGLDVNNVPSEWLETFKKAGLTNDQLKDPKTAKFVMKFMQEHNADGQPIATGEKKRPPPPPPARRRAPPEVPPVENQKKPSPPDLPKPTRPVIQKKEPEFAAVEVPNLPRRISKDMPALPPPEPVKSKPEPPKKNTVQPTPPPPSKKKNSLVPESEAPPLPDMLPPPINMKEMGSPGVPPPPPPFSPPPFSPPPISEAPKARAPKQQPAIVPADDLLAAIRGGGVKALKKVEVDDQPRKSVAMGGSDLAGALALALADRNKVMVSSDEEQEEDDGEWSD